MIIVYSHETAPLGVECAALLGNGETVVSAACRLTRLDTGEDAASALQGAATVAGTVVTQVVHGLAAGGRYRLEVDVTIAVDKILTVPVDLTCPF